MTILFNTTKLTEPEFPCGVFEKCPENMAKCTECWKIANQSNDEEE